MNSSIEVSRAAWPAACEEHRRTDELTRTTYGTRSRPSNPRARPGTVHYYSTGARYPYGTALCEAKAHRRVTPGRPEDDDEDERCEERVVRRPQR
jgi:hypothetical protein